MLIPPTPEMTSDRAKDPRGIRLVCIQVFLLALVVAIVIRLVVISPFLNYYKPVTSGSAKKYYGDPSTCIEPLKFTPFAPGYAFENSIELVRFYSPEKSQIAAYASAFAHQPIEMGFGSYHYDAQEQIATYRDSTDKLIPKPKAADLPYFGMRVNVMARYVTQNADSSAVLADPLFQSADFRRFSDCKPSNIFTKDVPVRVVPGWMFTANGGAYCYWSDRIGPIATDYLSIHSGVTKIALVMGNECWADPHSKFYTRYGDLGTRPKNNNHRGDYTMIPHLTLLYDKTNGKLAGGYWWGVFRSLY